MVSSLDFDLQEYGELLMKGKSGSIIAIEPATGEILTMVSGPSYDPNLLTGKNYSSNFVLISNDTNKPFPLFQPTTPRAGENEEADFAKDPGGV